MAKRSQLVLVLGLAAVVVLGQACGGGSAGSADMGATPGGAQDNGLARDQIDEGLVPHGEDITVEGMLNDHDLPLEAPPCERDFCIRAAYAVAPALDTGRAAVFVQMGFSSGIDETSFRRAPLNLAVVVDRSGSMDGEKLNAVKLALSRLVDKLDPRDRLAIVLFDDRVDLLLESTLVENPEAIKARISDIYARGSTDMASGLRSGYAQVALNGGVEGVMDRVMVFSDAMVNTGDTGTETFIGLANDNAQRGVGLTVFGVGIDLNQELVLAISKLRGGNYFYLKDAAKIASVFDVDFDFLVTPLAYDLKFRLEPKAGFRIGQVYGYSAWQTGSSSVEINVATVFLSRNHGAIVARLEVEGSTWPLGKPPLAELSLQYESRAGELVSDAITAAYGADEALRDTTVFYSQRAVRKTVALVNTAVGEKRSCELFWQGSRAEARDLLQETVDLLVAEAAEIEDAELTGEAADAQKLLDNMSTAIDHGTDYPINMGDDTAEYPAGGLFACSVGGDAPASAGLLLLALALCAARALRKR
ncbi:MAG: VWA domain-containing protein [Thermoanaerobaculaceae bacterium]|jgi:Ca-activated chloride channel family protein|nr:VWA domain-containing protein [Thermoanaerobaculaceae bacterium]